MLDQASRHNFATTAGGARISSSIESGLLGRGGDIQLLDDLMTLKQAESELETRTVLQAFSEGLPTRVTNSATSARVLVGQRVSENDVTNLAVETWKDATWLMFPARYEVLRNCPQDRRAVEGELLTPELWPEEELRKVELGLAGLDKGSGALSSFGAAAQLQQSPIVRGGGVIRREDWQIWPEGPAPDPKDLKINARGEYQVMLPLMQYIIVAVDTAYSEREESSMNGMVCLGVWSRRREEVSRAQPWMASRWGTVEPDPAEIEHLLEGQEQPRVILCEAFQTRAPLNDQTPDPRTGRPRGLVQRVAEVCRRREANRRDRGHEQRPRHRRRAAPRAAWDGDRSRADQTDDIKARPDE